jgi:hypothetical protein
VVDHKCHEDVSPALGPVESILPVQLHQSALWAAHIQRLFYGYVERARNTFASSPDRGDGFTMPVGKTFVNHFVVIFFMNYIFCSFDTESPFVTTKSVNTGLCGRQALCDGLWTWLRERVDRAAPKGSGKMAAMSKIVRLEGR